jgi:hypothetical protein
MNCCLHLQGICEASVREQRIVSTAMSKPTGINALRRVRRGEKGKQKKECDRGGGIGEGVLG